MRIVTTIINYKNIKSKIHLILVLVKYMPLSWDYTAIDVNVEMQQILKGINLRNIKSIGMSNIFEDK
ncbi:Phenylalanine--tRNA ligase beta subunit [Frankliniella fusca]|uniref:Phenylalanine--tRNA ligase beta subunit n=1 Tax=Frankliniella fusca TaxID=407009 RepID=A0AAE1LGZ1_9NEOP|nr:Phenylalanine--tRNA ligase beta subunit [Frankliniella fusca]